MPERVLQKNECYINTLTFAFFTFCLFTAPPMWRNKQKPQNADAVEDDDVVFECNVVGRPKPTVSWTYNALSLDQGLWLPSINSDARCHKITNGRHHQHHVFNRRHKTYEYKIELNCNKMSK